MRGRGPSSAFRRGGRELAAAGIARGTTADCQRPRRISSFVSRDLDLLAEARRGERRLGTTSRGIGPAYEDKIARRGIRRADCARACPVSARSNHRVWSPRATCTRQRARQQASCSDFERAHGRGRRVVEATSRSWPSRPQLAIAATQSQSALSARSGALFCRMSSLTLITSGGIGHSGKFCAAPLF